MRATTLPWCLGLVGLATGCFNEDPVAGGAGDTSGTTAGTGTGRTTIGGGDGSADDPNDGGSSSSATGPAPDDTGPADACSPDEACISTFATDGWAGPVAIVIANEGDDPVACPDGWGAGPIHFQELIKPQGACACDCGDAQLEGSCTYSVASFGGTTCGGQPNKSVAAPAPACEQVTALGESYDATTTAQGTCTDGVVANMQPGPHTWMRRVQACAPNPEWATCGDEAQCWPGLPSPLEPQVCIWRDGIHRCDARLFQNQRIAFGGVNGMVGCPAGDPCTCEPGDLACEGGRLGLYDGKGCASGPSDQADLGSCLLVGSPKLASVGVSVEATLTGTCDTTPLPPIDTLEPAQPRTYCCGTPESV